MNGLTGEHHDPDVNTPAYKEIAVTMRNWRMRHSRTRFRCTTSATASARRWIICPLNKNGSSLNTGCRLNTFRIRRKANGRTAALSTHSTRTEPSAQEALNELLENLHQHGFLRPLMTW